MKYRIITNTENTKITSKNLKLLAEYTESVSSDESEVTDTEIVLGKTNRKISAKAEALLNEKLSGEVGYAILAEGGSVAAVWSDLCLEEAAIKHIAENIDKISDGYSFTDSFALMPYLKERGERIKEEKWAKFAQYLGEDGAAIVEEFKKLYSLFDERNVKWLANLYDPESGAWYHSNGGRDTFGYLPGIEESYDVLCFFSLSGIAEMLDRSSNILTPEMKEKLAEFVYSKQAEDTYFYLPQWPKEFILDNNLQSRITRDKGSALWILSSLGKEPKYKELPKKPTTEKKSDAPRALVQFESVESFREYLDGLERDYLALDTPEKRAYQFYCYGNLFQSTTGYINANPEFKKMLLEFFEKYQNKETGTWAEMPCFNAVNGLHKIACVYNAIGARLNYIDKAIDTTMKQLCVSVEEKPAYSSIDVYNIWSVFPYLYKNIMSFGEGTEEERTEKKEEIKKLVYAAAPDAIRTGYGQVVGLRCKDSAFSSRGGASPFHMGCPVTLPGLHEGTTVSLYSLTHHIFMALEAEEYEIPYCTEYERVIFTEELNKVIERGALKKTKAPYRIITNTPEDKQVLRIAERLGEVVNVTGIYTDEEPRQVLEIVLGETSRDISKSSRERLDKALSEKGASSGFSIHSLGSIGITYTDEKSLEAAIDHFLRLFPSVNTVKVTKD